MVADTRPWPGTNACCDLSFRNGRGPAQVSEPDASRLEHQPVPLPGIRAQTTGGFWVGCKFPSDASIPGVPDTLGYPFVEETKNPVYKLFLQA